MICEQCRKPDLDTRPWGPNRTNICFDCAYKTPEMRLTVEANRDANNVFAVCKNDEQSAINALIEMRYTCDADGFQNLLRETMTFFEQLVPDLHEEILVQSMVALLSLPKPSDRTPPTRSPSRTELIAAIARDIAIYITSCGCQTCRMAVVAASSLPRTEIAPTPKY